jgi:hypothetical protein
MRLNHWTNASGLEGVLRDRLIRATWPTETSVAIPDRVVWLTTRTDSDQGWKFNESLCAYLIVEVPDEEVVAWSQYRQELPWAVPGVLEDSALRNGNGDPATWFVLRRGIPEAEWLEIVDLRDAS